MKNSAKIGKTLAVFLIALDLYGLSLVLNDIFSRNKYKGFGFYIFDNGGIVGALIALNGNAVLINPSNLKNVEAAADDVIPYELTGKRKISVVLLSDNSGAAFSTVSGIMDIYKIGAILWNGREDPAIVKDEVAFEGAADKNMVPTVAVRAGDSLFLGASEGGRNSESVWNEGMLDGADRANLKITAPDYDFLHSADPSEADLEIKISYGGLNLSIARGKISVTNNKGAEIEKLPKNIFVRVMRNAQGSIHLIPQ